MALPQAVVLYGDGINCDRETAWALDLAGFASVRMHVSDLLDSPSQLSRVKLLALPGGFSFGDEIASGKVLAIKLKRYLEEALRDYIDRDGIVLGICNGFQVIVQMGLAPVSGDRTVSLTRNASGRFINKWVSLKVADPGSSPFLDGLDDFDLPVRHGEGRLVLKIDLTDDKRAIIEKQGVIRYVDDVNGSHARIAGLVGTTGLVFGLMPHPEAFVRWTQHPAWTQRRLTQVKTEGGDPPGLRFFKNIVAMVR